MLKQSDRVATDSLKPYRDNPRRGNVELIAESLEKNGQYRPLVVRVETREILAGNHTWLAAQSLGWNEVDVWLVDVDDETAARIVLADNRLSDIATFDDQALADLLSSLEDLTGTGYEQGNLDDLLKSLDTSEPTQLTDPDDIPDLPEEPVSKLGDIWELGPHRLLVGDATADLTPLMSDDLADLVLTDPPYNVAVEGKTKDKLTIENDKMTELAFLELLTNAFGRTASVSKAGAPFYCFHADSHRVSFQTSAEQAGWSIRQNLIWVKNSMVMSRQDYHWKHEPILYGWLPGAAHTWFADRKQTTVIEWERPTRNAEHPTMKPVGLLRYLISNSSLSGDVVLDSFAGSGSTLIACHAEKRIARLVELDPKYADVICRRFEEHTGIVPKRSGKSVSFAV